jgi:long-chain acyl-CoA synthetase
VRLVHDNWTYEAAAVDALKILTPDDVQYLWLPLSHSFGKVLEVLQLRIGFATAIDGNLDRIVDNLGVVKPTFMAGAPRIFEKVRSRVITGVEAEGGLKARIFGWAFGVGHKVSQLRQQGQEPSGLLARQHALADKLVFHKIRDRLGGRVRFFVSGSAALSRDVAEWFHAAGMTILEGYGLTETSAATAVNLPDDTRFGTVGPPAPGTQVQIAGDGELLVKGPGVMRGYHNNSEQTAEVFTDDGWFRTGDIAELDRGYIRITDRKKDLIKTSGGKYVAPQKIEVIFKAVSPYASQIVVHGDGRNYCTALITLDPDAIASWAEHNDLAGTPYPDLVATVQVHELVQGNVDELNARLERWETIKKFEILPQDLSVEEGDLTPSLKVKRRVVEKKYADTLDRMYTS